MKQVVYTEHQNYKDAKTGTIEEEEFKEILQKHGVTLHDNDYGFMEEPKYLGLSRDLQVSYYIGADWLVEKELALVVLPKIEKIDFMQMLLCALSADRQEEVDYFAKCYGIETNQPTIETDADQSYLTPILLIHYLSLVERVVKYGLRKDYCMVENNLKGKIKGHLLLQQHLRQNVMMKREDMTYCRYQVYTEDIPVNRLLKRALVFAQRMLNECMAGHVSYTVLHVRMNRAMAAFARVSDDVELSEVRYVPQNAMYRHYSEAIKVAKMILRRYDYSMSNISKANHATPPFWIDMSRLYEMYVLSKLREEFGHEILFQVPGYGKSKVDYVHTREKLILDAKYKPQYADSNSGMLDDVREISGYARDRKILKTLGVDNEDKEVKCVIIYPVEAEKEYNLNAATLWERATDIDAFRNFKKMAIAVPQRQL